MWLYNTNIHNCFLLLQSIVWMVEVTRRRLWYDAPSFTFVRRGCPWYVLGMYLLYAAIHYLISRSIVPTNKLILIVFFVSVSIVFLANASTPLDVINLVFIASLFIATIIAWLLHRLISWQLD
jgi:hypothetical protein